MQEPMMIWRVLMQYTIYSGPKTATTGFQQIKTHYFLATNITELMLKVAGWFESLGESVRLDAIKACEQIGPLEQR